MNSVLGKAERQSLLQTAIGRDITVTIPAEEILAHEGRLVHYLEQTSCLEEV